MSIVLGVRHVVLPCSIPFDNRLHQLVGCANDFILLQGRLRLSMAAVDKTRCSGVKPLRW